MIALTNPSWFHVSRFCGTLSDMQRFMDQSKIRELIASLADQIAADTSLEITPENPLALVGIRSRGELLAQRLADALQLKNKSKQHIDVGALDITMYRDDLTFRGGRGSITIPQGTEMNFRLDDRPLILCDDVLDTGRSVRAALDALVDFGRPRIIRLAVLINRDRHEFPIAADYTGQAINPPNPTQKIMVRLTPTDPEDAVYLK